MTGSCRRARAGTAVLAALLLTAACGGGESAVSDPADGSDTAPSVTTPEPAPPGSVNCQYYENLRASGERPDLPPMQAPNDAPRYATIVTNLGTIQIELDAEAAPCTVNSFVSLAGQGFYDDTSCHRLLDESGGGRRFAVLQCGDPTGTGSGGPEYQYPDENLEGAAYDKGVVAMANAGANTNGSQFFMMFDDSDFAPDYTPFGAILSGVEVLQKVADGGRDVRPGSGASDVPKTELTFEKVTTSSEKPKS